MKVFSLATLTLKRNKKQYMIYGLTLIFAIVIHLIFSEFINNPYLIEEDRARGIDGPLGADIARAATSSTCYSWPRAKRSPT